MISKLGLDDWKFAIPAAMLVGIPAISNEVINQHFQAYSYLCTFFFRGMEYHDHCLI